MSRLNRVPRTRGVHLLSMIAAVALIALPGAFPAQASSAATSSTAAEMKEPTRLREPIEQDSTSRHRFTLLARTSLALHLSDARTSGGFGGGVGLRDVVGDYLVLQGDIAWLTQLGNVLAVRAGAGIQKPGTWSPAALVAVTGMLGSQLTFPAEGRPASPGPALSIGLVLSPLRFVTDKAEVSILEIGAGIGAETPGFATSFSIGFEVGAHLF